VRRSAELHGEVALRGPAAGGAALAGLPTGAEGGGLVEAEARLDLTDPTVRALAARLLHGDLGAAPALANHVADHARLDVRVFATDHDERSGGLSVGGNGYETLDRTDTARLVYAAGRDPGLPWARRIDCVGVA
jgi:hypothetical protein